MVKAVSPVTPFTYWVNCGDLPASAKGKRAEARTPFSARYR
jgi:hypothetical protein